MVALQDYLRISVTDRCDFRCLYCLPKGLPPPQRRASLLTYEEQVVVAQTVENLTPLKKVRLTGGEPLLRQDLHHLVGLLSSLPSHPTIALTTNGVRLAKALPALMDAGLTTVNISIDHPDSDPFSRLTGGGNLSKVLEGLRAAKSAGIHPLRINSVMTKETVAVIPALIELAVNEGADLRLIEMMPFGDNKDYFGAHAVSASQIETALAPHVGKRVQPEQRGRGPARDYALSGTPQTAGVIAAFSDPGCETCSRLRVSSTGRISHCLFQTNGVELFPSCAPYNGSNSYQHSRLLSLRNEPTTLSKLEKVVGIRYRR
ncbi:radical SAM protein [bacterium]|nr:radical SAM protein [bacterium]